MSEEVTEVTIIRLTRKGDQVSADMETVENYDPVDPQAVIGACANIISEMNQYVFSHPQAQGEA